MSDFRVASRYAKSLIELVAEKGVLEQVKNDMELFYSTVEGTYELELLLKSPIISHYTKADILKAIFQGKVTDLTISFIEIVCRKAREASLLAASEDFIRQYNQMKGIMKAKVTTSTELTPAMRQQFERMVLNMTKGNQVQLTADTDESLIGGYVLQIGDRQIDDSVKSRLERLEEEFLK